MFIRKKKVLKLINEEIERLKMEESRHYKNFIIDTDGEVSTYESARYIQASQDRLNIESLRNKLE